MNRWTTLMAAAATAATLLLGPAPARADEGMWLYDRVPVAQIEADYGFTPSQELLEHLRLASADPGASAAFVSPDGLILTNHHVVLGSVQRLSSPEHNYVQDGFYAASREQEIPIPGNTINVLLEITDVTGRVMGAVKPGASAAEAKQARDREIAAIEKECLPKDKKEIKGAATTRGEVVTLYGGAVYNLYRYKQYTDIRLVFTPELQAAFFGGDWDNFGYPRYDLDFAFVRAYENGQPARVEHWLAFEPRGVADGELVFVTGNPGRTERLKTVACLDYLRETYPERLRVMLHGREILRGYSARGPEEARRARTLDYFYGNSIKRMEGELAGLTNVALMAKKAAQEQALREAVASDPDLSAAYGEVWDRAAAAYAWAREHADDVTYRSEMPGSRFFGTALQMVRYAAEMAKPDRERLPGYHDADLPGLLRRLQSPAPVYKDMEAVLAADSFARLREALGPDDPFVQAVLQGREPADAAAHYLEGTRLEDAAVRQQLLEKKGKTIAGSDDRLLDLARRLDPALRAIQQAKRENIQAVEQEAETQLALARFAVYGDKLYPDATGTLRLAFGKVAGYPFATTMVPPFTTFHGLFDRAYGFGDQGDFQLTARQRERRDRLDLATPMNFVCTADITGGNSGSPVVNREGRLVGVDARAMLQALGVLYDAQPLVDELLGASGPRAEAAP